MRRSTGAANLRQSRHDTQTASSIYPSNTDRWWVNYRLNSNSAASPVDTQQFLPQQRQRTCSWDPLAAQIIPLHRFNNYNTNTSFGKNSKRCLVAPSTFEKCSQLSTRNKMHGHYYIRKEITRTAIKTAKRSCR